MLIRHPHLFRLAIFGVVAGAVLMMLPRSAAFAAPAMAVYRGEAPAASGPGRTIELRLKADGTMSMVSDYGNSRAPITEDGHWNPVSVEQPERYTLDLQNGGKALVRADCNRGQAAYKLDGRAIAIKVSGMTKVACPPGSLSQRYVKALQAAVGQRIKGDILFLDLPGEGGTMKFVRAR